MIVQKGIELWVQEGSCLLPPTNFPVVNQKKDLHQIIPNGRPPFLENPTLPLVGRIKIASVIIEEENVQQWNHFDDSRTNTVCEIKENIYIEQYVYQLLWSIYFCMNNIMNIIF